ncbi:MAG TPA: pseudouridine-5'-phosphate glycosidase [Actinomycetota bacterium]|nr:pseudouridine-5'-phosphate glycosidase [Actinomycetota bacterium]
MSIVVAPEVAGALARGAPVVALESAIVTHGLPRPDNLAVARDVEAAVRAGGAVPATIAVLDGAVRVGVADAELECLARGDEARKLGARDLGTAVASGATGGTTVSATATIAARAGVDVFATGGLGGVHVGARDTWDVSADVLALRDAPVVVVCSGVKSILDVPATVELLESSSVAVAAYRSDTLPGFYVADTGVPAPWRLDDAGAVAAAHRAARALGARGALVVANPPDPATALERAEHDALVAEALDDARARGVSERDVTPHLLSYLARHSGGRTLTANRDLVVRNARLAADVAVALAR